jgi:DNA-binding transcriptional ArsR family regulator
VTGNADIAAVGAALADPGRAEMLLALLGGEALSAGELARIADRSPSGTTAHLRALRDAGLVVAEDVGRHRFFRLAGTEVADALEALARIAPPRPARGLRESEAMRALKRARTCYDHLAGELGVSVTEALVDQGVLEPDADAFRVTGPGERWFDELGVDLGALLHRRRSFARSCLDWTERRPHLAGSLGAALAQAFFDRGWVRRLPGGRSLAVTAAGATWLQRELDVGSTQKLEPRKSATGRSGSATPVVASTVAAASLRR